MNNNGYRIVVDAGHGGVDSGAVSGNLKEKDFNLQAANYMYNRFKELGVPVAITRDTDKTLTRNERLNTMRNTFGNDPKVIVLSNHINAGGGEGAEVVYPLRTSPTLAKNILDEIGARGQIKRKIYQRVLPENPSKDYYYIMREIPNTTALLIEYGFIDNPRDAAKLQSNLLNYVEGVVKAVSEYIGVPYTQPGSNIEGDTYTVQKGDTLYSIALKYNTNVNDLKRLNNLENNILQVGQVLRIPKRNIPESENENLYTVLNGDSLYSIANKYNVTVSDLIDANNLPTTVLTVGQTLIIPNRNNEVSGTTYIVKPGDTLYKIARLFNVSLDDLIKSNNLNSNVLSIGQTLTIPSNDVNEEDYVVYEIQNGDTLYSIARRYNTKVDSIKAYNNLVNNFLRPGDTIQIPITPVETEYNTYTVQKGDTLYSIARRFNTTVADLLAINNNLNSILQIGELIKIPKI